jgi:hypothetical protein
MLDDLEMTCAETRRERIEQNTNNSLMVGPLIYKETSYIFVLAASNRTVLQY